MLTPCKIINGDVDSHVILCHCFAVNFSACFQMFSGVFKIEDSAKLAQLWGECKNCPAMNYDKLSRSIRGYYKNGIIHKTPTSQRLVYQFCLSYLWLRQTAVQLLLILHAASITISDWRTDRLTAPHTFERHTFTHVTTVSGDIMGTLLYGNDL